MVEVATLEWRGEERETGGRQRWALGWETTVPCRAMLEPLFPTSGEVVRRGWVGRGAPSSDMPFLSSLQQADSPQPCTPRHRPEESDCPGTGDMLAAETLSRTYRGTGRCSQGRGLCNSGWRRSWLGNLGNLMGKGARGPVSEASPTAWTLIRGNTLSPSFPSLPCITSNSHMYQIPTTCQALC